eukprot:Hpha_TRINITY_DN15317_c0_g11::TRINITY_DN15317_c0_g11_i1::g.89524::m.89524
MRDTGRRVRGGWGEGADAVCVGVVGWGGIVIDNTYTTSDPISDGSNNTDEGDGEGGHDTAAGLPGRAEALAEVQSAHILVVTLAHTGTGLGQTESAVPGLAPELVGLVDLTVIVVVVVDVQGEVEVLELPSLEETGAGVGALDEGPRDALRRALVAVVLTLVPVAVVHDGRAEVLAHGTHEELVLVRLVLRDGAVTLLPVRRVGGDGTSVLREGDVAQELLHVVRAPVGRKVAHTAGAPLVVPVLHVLVLALLTVRLLVPGQVRREGGVRVPVEVAESDPLRPHVHVRLHDAPPAVSGGVVADAHTRVGGGVGARVAVLRQVRMTEEVVEVLRVPVAVPLVLGQVGLVQHLQVLQRPLPRLTTQQLDTRLFVNGRLRIDVDVVVLDILRVSAEPGLLDIVQPVGVALLVTNNNRPVLVEVSVAPSCSRLVCSLLLLCPQPNSRSHCQGAGHGKHPLHHFIPRSLGSVGGYFGDRNPIKYRN